jgi:hypothetical protein
MYLVCICLYLSRLYLYLSACIVYVFAYISCVSVCTCCVFQYHVCIFTCYLYLYVSVFMSKYLIYLVVSCLYLHVLPSMMYFAYMPLKHPSHSAGKAPRTDPCASIRSHAQSQPTLRVGVAPAAQKLLPCHCPSKSPGRDWQEHVSVSICIYRKPFHRDPREGLVTYRAGQPPGCCGVSDKPQPLPALRKTGCTRVLIAVNRMHPVRPGPPVRRPITVSRLQV